MRLRTRETRVLMFGAVCLVLGCLLLVGPEFEVAWADSVNTGRVVDLSRYRAQLFLHDDRVVDHQSGVDVVIGRIEKHPRPVLVPDKPWELGTVGYTCVLHDREEGLYKMWYESRENMGKPNAGEKGRCLYAVSKNGLDWEKPSLGLIRSEGSDQNNIVFMTPPGAEKTKVYWVIKDYAEPDPARLYKMMFHLWDYDGRGVGIAHSPDGIRWTATRHVKLHGGFDSQNLFFWDDRVGQYVGYLRTFTYGKRSIGRSLSPDAFHWSEPVTVHATDENDPPAHDLYTPTIFKYRQADDVYVMFTAVFDRESNTVFGQLAVSRDGIRWHRFREPFVPLGGAGAWDAGSIYPVGAEVVVGGKNAIYYRGNDYGHGAGGSPGFGVAFLHEGGFVGRRAKGRGTLTTHPLRVADARRGLTLNADAAGGSIRAELLTTDGSVIPGFSRAEFRVITGKGADLPLEWEGKEVRSALMKGDVRLRLYLDKATVYGFRSVNSRRPPG